MAIKHRVNTIRLVLEGMITVCVYTFPHPIVESIMAGNKSRTKWLQSTENVDTQKPDLSNEKALFEMRKYCKWTYHWLGGASRIVLGISIHNLLTERR